MIWIQKTIYSVFGDPENQIALCKTKILTQYQGRKIDGYIINKLEPAFKLYSIAKSRDCAEPSLHISSEKEGWKIPWNH